MRESVRHRLPGTDARLHSLLSVRHRISHIYEFWKNFNVQLYILIFFHLDQFMRRFVTQQSSSKSAEVIPCQKSFRIRPLASILAFQKTIFSPASGQTASCPTRSMTNGFWTQMSFVRLNPLECLSKGDKRLNISISLLAL